jgi:hypothetical protein
MTSNRVFSSASASVPLPSSRAFYAAVPVPPILHHILYAFKSPAANNTPDSGEPYDRRMRPPSETLI